MFPLTSSVRLSSRHWPAGRRLSGDLSGNKAFLHCPFPQDLRRVCSTASAMPPLLEGLAWLGRFRLSFRSRSCSSDGPFPSQCSFELLPHTRQQRNTARRRRTSVRFRSSGTQLEMQRYFWVAFFTAVSFLPASVRISWMTAP